MAYTVLARRYRSTTFDEIVGQEHIARTLKRAIESGRIAHAFLFCGTRGTGKTSTARIMAKALNCKATEGPNPNPCNKCDSCTSVTRGESMDVIEIDAASHTGVDSVREVIENSQYRPANSRFKVYIIDEVHMLSKAAFNALLKTLEEPPSHVKFILATTEAEKVLPTILSRCQRYDFRNIPTRQIAGHLKAIATAEKINAAEDALLLVAKAGAGSMRDALSLLDRLLSFGDSDLTVEMIEQLLGMPKSQVVFDLAESIGGGDVKAVLEAVEDQLSRGFSADALAGALVDHLRSLLILRTCGADSRLVEVPGLAIEQLVGQATRFEPVFLSQDIAIIEELRRQMRTSQAGRALLDATMVRLTLAEQFTRLEDVGQPPSPASTAKPTVTPARPAPAIAPEKKKIDPTEPSPAMTMPAPLSASGKSGDEAATATAAQPTAGPAYAAPSADLSSQPDADTDDALPAVGRVWNDAPPKRNPLLKPREPARPVPPTFDNVEPVGGSFGTQWSSLLGRLSFGVRSVLEQARPAGVVDGHLQIELSPKHETFLEMFENGKKDHIRQAVADSFGAGVGVKFSVESANAQASANVQAPILDPPRRATRPALTPEATVQPAPMSSPTLPITPDLREEMMQNPMVRAVVEYLGGQIVRVEQSDV